MTAAATQASNAQGAGGSTSPRCASWGSTSRPSRSSAPWPAAWPAGRSRWPKARSRWRRGSSSTPCARSSPWPRTPPRPRTRFRELVHAAIEQFNEGHLGRAVTMFELAEQLVAEQEGAAGLRRAPCASRATSSWTPSGCGSTRERTDLRPQLRAVLNFFDALRPAALLEALNGEPKRERRHELLALLEAHEQAGPRGRRCGCSRRPWSRARSADPFFQMNLVYLLRIIPRPAAASVEDEVNAVMRDRRAAPAPRRW